jgi:hypothetical protein
MANAIALIKLLISLGPDIMKFIKAIEEMMPDSGKGSEKLAVLRGYLEAVWEGFGTGLPAFEEFWPKLNAVVTAVVATFNSIGWFKK